MENEAANRRKNAAANAERRIPGNQLERTNPYHVANAGDACQQGICR